MSTTGGKAPDAADLAALEALLGAGNLRVDEGAMGRFARTTEAVSHPPSALALPGDKHQVAELVRLAGARGLRLHPVSRGRNYGYGTATPASPGALVVSLERLDRIVRVDEDLAYAVLQPGVSYRQLDAHLTASGRRLWTDCTDGPPDGSVLGNALEKGIGETRYGDHFGNLCGLEVVLPDGSLVRTGGGPEADSRVFHVHKWGTGPYLEGLFAQSSMGIVVEAGMWLMPAPEAYLPFTFGLHDDVPLGEALEPICRLSLEGLLDTKLHLVNEYVIGCLIDAPFGELAGSPWEALGKAGRDRLRQRYLIPRWSFGGALYGRREEVEARRRILTRELSRFGRVQFLPERRARFVERRLLPFLEWARDKPFWAGLGDAFVRKVLKRSPETLALAPRIHRLLQGVPSDEFVKHAYVRGSRRGEGVAEPAGDGVGLIWLAPILPFARGDIESVLERCEALHDRHGFDFYAAFLRVNPRAVVLLMALHFDRSDPDHGRRAEGLYDELAAELHRMGYQQYRTRTTASGILDPAPGFRALAEKLTWALDPGGVLSPGRYGLRGEDRPGGGA